MWENVRFSMNSTMPLFFVMLLGYVLYQKKFLSDAFVAGANKFVFYVALPVQLFRDLAATDVRAAFDGAYVLFCFVVTLVSILGIWALAKLFLPDKRLVGEFVQVCYRQCVRHHHPVQRIQPDFLAVFAAEHGLHRLNET